MAAFASIGSIPATSSYEDGTRFYPMGYECDWLWALDLGKPTIDATTAFLDLISAPASTT